MWWFNRIPRPQVDIASFDDPYLLEVQTYHRSLGRDLYVLDITIELDIPCFVALSRQLEGPPNWVLGLGCHLDAPIALSRAITEANQILPMAVPEILDEAMHYTAGNKERASWTQTALPEDHPYLVPHPRLAPKTAADYPACSSDDLLTDLETCVRRARQDGMQVLFVDQTHPDIGVPVVRMIVLGAYHFWCRFEGEELYKKPVEAGWCSTPKQEAAMNPIAPV